MPKAALHETYEGAKQLIKGSGYKISAGSYETERLICVFSVETIPGTFGHPKATVLYNKETGMVQAEGLRGAAKYFHSHDVFCGPGCYFRREIP